jgi:hypothetical protein
MLTGAVSHIFVIVAPSVSERRARSLCAAKRALRLTAISFRPWAGAARTVIQAFVAKALSNRRAAIAMEDLHPHSQAHQSRSGADEVASLFVPAMARLRRL